ncbi:MAG: TfoX/Sxy family protein [Candidatus Nomurabacteria bacterium]|jgi:TfoX/Sxy family transcriptional regulator of competence genes|nr:TfoX/Sxy family protein [Candidatus Nomurabacteria bacterium]
MATTVDFVEYITESLAHTGTIRYRKMFGEYMVYVNEKPLVLVCDNTAFVKMLPCVEDLLSETGYPYSGAKEHYVLDPERPDLDKIIARLDEAIPKSKPKKGNK